MARETLLLIDGHALVYRAFFAMPALTNSRGEMTNAVFGFTSMLLKALNDYDPAYAIAAFDPPGPTFRHEEFAAYKEQRPAAPDELRRQMPLARRVVEVLGIPIVQVSGFEADDVIGTLARRAEGEGLDVIIVTGDLDSLQLVTPHVRVFSNRRGISETIVYDLDRVRERYGFEPPLVADFKALQGDVSDNIPGVPGIGEKTAMQLVQQHGALERILEAVPSMKEGRVKRTLTEHADQARFSKRMATIVCDLDVDLDLEGARCGDYDREATLALFDELEFRSLVARLPVSHREAPADTGPAFQEPEGGTRIVVLAAEADAEDAVGRLRASPGVAVRTLVDEPARTGRIAGVALAAVDDPAVAYYLPVAHDQLGGAADTRAVELVAELLGDPTVPVCAYDVKRELLAWRTRGVTVRGVDFDLMLAAYLTNTRQRVPSLSLLIADHLDITLDADDAVLGSGRTARTPATLPVAEASQHYGRLVALAGPVRAALERLLDDWHVRHLHDAMELPLAAILADMEVHGIMVDRRRLGDLAVELQQRIDALQAEVEQTAGHGFNIGSTQQLAKVLYDDLGLAAGRRTKTGRSTDADTLEALRSEHPVVDLVLEWRQLTKLKGTYVDALPQLADASGRVHTSFNQAVATTGRLSSSDPNLQNIPVRSEWGQRIRATFVAEADDLVLVSADYSQIELRVLAHVTGDEDLIDAFRRGEDIHARTAAEVCRVDRTDVTPEMRRNAKVVNFGVVYGLSDFGLARDTGMSQEEARAFISAYFDTFRSVTTYLERIRQYAREWGYVETLFGRRRYIPDIRAANRQIRLGAERMAVNMPIQGTAADIMKLAMIRTDERLRQAGMRSRLLLQVHDELVLEAPESEVEALADLLGDAMGGAASLVVPLDVDVKVGRNWSAMAPLPRAATA